jgi:hypothetical protein
MPRFHYLMIVLLAAILHADTPKGDQNLQESVVSGGLKTT